ncbi:MAG: hypothetical protein JSW15_06745 [Deltaproteobacteria bacterium]|nr:MAG: hypothetical protein JSW15_06745 [Deltaproteobacteria bacterium]
MAAFEIAIGFIAGLLSGVAAAFLLRAINMDRIRPSTILAHISAIMAFMGGGSWAATVLFRDAFDQIGHYAVSLAIGFILVFGPPLARWIFKLALDVGQGSE